MLHLLFVVAFCSLPLFAFSFDVFVFWAALVPKVDLLE